MPVKLSFADYLAVAGIVAAIILIVLDKAGKLRGSMLLVLLAVAALLTVPLLLSLDWVAHAEGPAKFSRVLLMLCVVGLAYSVLAVWVSPSDAARQTETSAKSNIQIPDEVENVRVSVNEYDFPRHIIGLEKFGIDLTRGLPQGAPTIIGGRVYAEDRHPYFDGQIKVGDITVEIKRNRLVATPDGWDRNENDRAIEIISDKRKVVFQLILQSAEHVYIDAGRYVNDENWTTERLFKYPSVEHRGEFASWVKILPLTAKTLYQFFLTDCQTGGSRTTRVLKNGFSVERVICRDFNTKSAYLSVFIPQPNAEPAIQALASEYREMIDEEDRAGFSRGTVFTGRVIIYHDRLLLDRQINELKLELEKNGADPIFRGADYAVARNSPIYGH